MLLVFMKQTEYWELRFETVFITLVIVSVGFYLLRYCYLKLIKTNKHFQVSFHLIKTVLDRNKTVQSKNFKAKDFYMK